jgi:hypothetical protein
LRFWVIIIEKGFIGFDCHLFGKTRFRTSGIELPSSSSKIGTLLNLVTRI